MSKSNTTENDVLAKIFQDIDYPWDASATLYLSLHTADPTDAGNQGSSEATYTGYDRVAVARDATGWDLAGNVASNDDLLQFPQCTGGSNVITHVAVGIDDHPTAGQILYSGALNASLTVSNLIQPQFAIGALTITED